MTFGKICLQNGFGFLSFVFFKIVFWSNCSSVFANTGQNPFAVSYNLSFVTSLAFKLSFLGFFTTFTTTLHKMFEIFIYLYILEDFCFFGL